MRTRDRASAVYRDKNDIESDKIRDWIKTLPPDTVVVKRKIVGERGVEYRLKPGRIVPNSERKLIRELCAELPVEYEALTVIRDSPMRKLIAQVGVDILNDVKR